MLRTLAAIAVALSLATPAAARSPSPEDAVMSTLDVCQSIERGASPAPALTAVGYSAPRQGDDRWSRQLGNLKLQVALTERPQANGMVFHFCTVGVWGGLTSSARVQGLIEARARNEGYTISAPTPRATGGTIQAMNKATATGMSGFSIIIDDAADPAQSANLAVTYGWTR